MRGGPALIVCALAALLVGFLPGAAAAQGFLHWPQSPRSAAMGGTGAGLAAGPGAAFHSPAGIAWLDGTQLQVGARLAADGGSFHAFGEGEFDRDVGFAAAPTVFATHAIARDLTGGLAITSPWGIAVEWERPDEFAGRPRHRVSAARPRSSRARS